MNFQAALLIYGLCCYKQLMQKGDWKTVYIVNDSMQSRGINKCLELNNAQICNQEFTATHDLSSFSY